MGCRPPASEPIKRFTIDIPLTLHKRIKSQCAIRGENMAEKHEIRKLLEKQFPGVSPQEEGAAIPVPTDTEIRFCNFL